MKGKLEYIINHYGLITQLKYFQSEVFEFNQAVLAEHYDKEGLYGDGDIDHIAEEIADVMVMLKQFQYYYEIEDKDIIDIMEKKVIRQIDRILETVDDANEDIKSIVTKEQFESIKYEVNK